MPSAMEFVWERTSFDGQFAMRTLIVNDSVTAYLYQLLMVHEVVPQSLPVGEEYLKRSLNAIVYNLARGGKRKKAEESEEEPRGRGDAAKHGQVLVSALSNIAVDQLMIKIHQTGLKVVRLRPSRARACLGTWTFCVYT